MHHPINRVGRLYGNRLYPVDENGMESPPVLGRDEADVETKRQLLVLRQLWCETRSSVRAAMALAAAPSPHAGDRLDVVADGCVLLAEMEQRVVGLALRSAGVCLPDEPALRSGFAQVFVDLGGGRSVTVFPGEGQAGRARVRFVPESIV